MIRIPSLIYEKLLEAAYKSSPEEMCGMLGGEIKNGIKSVERIYFLENIDHSRTHFSAEPKEQLAAVRDMRKRGLVYIGNFHSHIDCAAKPSAEDERLAYDEAVSYVIVSIAKEPQIRSYTLCGVELKEEELEIGQEEDLSVIK